MSTVIQTQLPVKEYLSTGHHPDVDYVDGRLEERNVGEKEHGKLQLRIAILLKAMPNVFPFIETRLKVSETRYRVPDVCVYLDREPDEQVFTAAPFLCVEILSPEDRMNRTLSVVQDYLAMGVPQVWILDPWEKKAYLVDSAGLRPVTGQIGATSSRVTLPIGEIFG